MKSFLNELDKDTRKALKKGKLSKKELGAMIYHTQDEVVDYYINNCFKNKDADKKGSPKQVIESFYAIMEYPKFAEAFQYNLKVQKKSDGEVVINIGYAVIINGFIEYYLRKYDEASRNQELIDAYVAILDKLLGKKAKKIAEKTGLDYDVVLEMLVIAPGPDFVSNPNHLNKYSQRMLRKLYAKAADSKVVIENTKQIKKLFTGIFGKKALGTICLGIMLEKKEFISGYKQSQLAVWNMMSEFALEYIASLEKGEIYSFIKDYCSARARDAKRGNDSARRINFTSLPNDERYAKINKVVGKIDDEKLTKYL